MTTQNNKPKKENQFVFVEYEKANEQGHKITIMDLYRNVIGRIHQSYNKELEKYEFTAYDHAGKEMFKDDQVWKIKKEFSNQREKLLEDAHQRRIESKKAKSVSQEVKTEKQQPTKQDEREKEIQNIRQNKGEQKERGQEMER